MFFWAPLVGGWFTGVSWIVVCSGAEDPLVAGLAWMSTVHNIYVHGCRVSWRGQLVGRVVDISVRC